MALALAGVIIALLTGPIGRAIARRISGTRPGSSTGETLALRGAELEDLFRDAQAAQARIAELEERLDFAERMLADRRDRDRIGPGQPS